MKAIAKVFAGEMVETARDVMREQSEDGAIQPCHLREAARRLGRTPSYPSAEYAHKRTLRPRRR